MARFALLSGSLSLRFERDTHTNMESGTEDATIEEAERLLKLLCDGDAERAVELITGNSLRVQKLRSLLVGTDTASWEQVEQERLNPILPIHKKLQEQIRCSLPTAAAEHFGIPVQAISTNDAKRRQEILDHLDHSLHKFLCHQCEPDVKQIFLPTDRKERGSGMQCIPHGIVLAWNGYGETNWNILLQADGPRPQLDIPFRLQMVKRIKDKMEADLIANRHTGERKNSQLVW